MVMSMRITVYAFVGGLVARIRDSGPQCCCFLGSGWREGSKVLLLNKVTVQVLDSSWGLDAFSDSKAAAEQVLDRGYQISINAVNQQFHGAAAWLKLQLLEYHTLCMHFLLWHYRNGISPHSP